MPTKTMRNHAGVKKCRDDKDLMDVNYRKIIGRLQARKRKKRQKKLWKLLKKASK